MDYVPKGNTKRGKPCCEFPCVVADLGSRPRARSASLRFARNKCKYSQCFELRHISFVYNKPMVKFWLFFSHNF